MKPLFKIKKKFFRYIKEGLEKVYEEEFGGNPDSSIEENPYNPIESVEERMSLDSILDRIIINSPNTTLDMVGGQYKAKEEIKSIISAIENPDVYRKWGATLPKGVIFYGEPGNGKTLLAKALATEANMPFYNITLNDISSRWAYETEIILQELIDYAKDNHERAVLFFDEFDAIGTNRKLLYNEPWCARIINIIASNMDGIQDNKLIYIVNTNYLEVIDPALLRAGRFDRHIKVSNPQYEERIEILNIHMKKSRRIAQRGIYNPHDINIEMLAEETIGFSGADLAEIIRRTNEEKAREEIAKRRPNLITTTDIIEQVNFYKRERNKY